MSHQKKSAVEGRMDLQPIDIFLQVQDDPVERNGDASIRMKSP